MPSLPPSNAFKGSSGWCCRMNVASIQPPDEKMLGGTSNTPRSRSPSARRDLGFMDLTSAGPQQSSLQSRPADERHIHAEIGRAWGEPATRRGAGAPAQDATSVSWI